MIESIFAIWQIFTWKRVMSISCIKCKNIMMIIDFAYVQVRITLLTMEYSIDSID